MRKKRFTGLLIRVTVAVTFIFSVVSTATALSAGESRVYPVVSELNVRALPSVQAKVVGHLRHGRWAPVTEERSDWLKIALPDGRAGYVLKNLTADTWVKVIKKEHRIILMKDRREVKIFPMGLGFNAVDDKIGLGDGCTPEGRFYICQVIMKPTRGDVYGPLALRISYPNVEDARRGLKDNIITGSQYDAILSAIHKGLMPPQNTKLGSSIKIHGGDPGADSDWTLGCMAMNNKDLLELFAAIPKRSALVEIYHDGLQDQNYNDENYVNRRTRNLKHFFDHHARSLTLTPPAQTPNQWRAGDIVLMDTGIENGTIYDHIGIVALEKNSNGVPLVINLWTVGSKLNKMELLNGDYPKIVGHYRLFHPFYYGL